MGIESPTGLNIVDILRDSLESRVKERIEEELLKRATKQFQSLMRAEIKKMVDEFSFENIKYLHNVLELRDELKVYISHNDGTTTQKDLGK